jgi:subtilisin-like proprotein convertase family protein
MMPLTLTLIKQAVRHGFKPLSLFFAPSITGLSAKLALIALIATTPFIASGETVYNHHEKIEVYLPYGAPYTVLLDQQIAMGPVSSIDSIRIDMEDLDYSHLQFIYDLDVKLIAPDGQTFHLIKSRNLFTNSILNTGIYTFNGTAEQTLRESRVFEGHLPTMYPGTYRAESWPTGSWEAGNWRLYIQDSSYSRNSFSETAKRIFNSITVDGTLDRSKDETFFSNTYEQYFDGPSNDIHETFNLGPVDYIRDIKLVATHSRVRDLTLKLIAPNGDSFIAINKPDTDANLGNVEDSLSEIRYHYLFSVHGVSTVSSALTLPDGQSTDYVIGHGNKQLESWPAILENGWEAGEWTLIYADDTAGAGGWLKSLSVTGGLRADPLTPWQVWLNDHFGTPDGSNDQADPDNDGRVNLAEYAFNLNPNDAADSHVHGLRIEATDGVPALIYRKNNGASDIRYHLEQTADLVSPNWQAAELEAETLLSEEGNAVEMRAPTSTPTESKYFYRLRIELE